MKRAALMGLLAIGSPSLAQNADDWDLRRDADSELVVAYSAFDNGLAIGARCSQGAYQVAIAGLPEISGDTRTLRIGFASETVEDQTWYVATEPGTAISSFPAPFARKLREGGRMDVVVPGGGEGGRNLRYVLNLPVSSRAIDESLAACGRALVDPRDAEFEEFQEDGLPAGIDWAVEPRPQFPAAARGNGFVTLTCVTQADGRLRDCVVEAEYPLRSGFARAALRSIGRSRLQTTDDPTQPLPVRMAAFIITFCVDGFCPGQRRVLPTGSRLPVTSPDG